MASGTAPPSWLDSALGGAGVGRPVAASGAGGGASAGLVGAGAGLIRLAGFGDLLPASVAGVPIADAPGAQPPGFFDRLQTLETIAAVIVGLIALGVISLAVVYVVHTLKTF